jgi:hypothetical protein
MRIRNRVGISLTLFLLIIIYSSLTSCQAFVAVTTPTPSVTQTLAPTATPAAPANVLWVDTTRDLGTISKFTLGVNYGAYAGIGLGNIDAVKNSGITLLRWPGGHWGDQNDVRPNLVDSYISVARNVMNAEPSITVRLLGGTPGQAAQLVRYVNIDKKYGVKYWSIGNEPDLFILEDQTWTPEYYAKRWREFALAMRAVDPSIQLYGPDISDYVGDAQLDPRELLYIKAVKQDFTKRDYLTEFLKVNADLVNIVTVHRYPFPLKATDGVASWDQLRDNTPQWDRILPNLRKLIKDTTGKEYPVGVMEFNSNSSDAAGVDTSPDSFYNALWLADILGRMIRHQPEMLAYWLLKSSPAGHGLMDSFDNRPTYYIYQIYKQFGNHLLVSNSDTQYVSIFAAKRDDGALTVIMVNLNDNEVRKPLQLDKGAALKLIEAYLFDATHKAEAVTPPSFTNGNEIVLPAQSVLMYIFK